MAFANEARRLRPRGTDFVYLSEGAYSVVFVDRRGRRIRKVYRVHDVGVAHCGEVFNAEIDAYNIASGLTELSALIPKYFGPCDVPDIVDLEDTNVSGEFHSHLAFEAEFVECKFVKIGEAPAPELVRIRDLFGRHGINHIIDASVCLDKNVIRKMIDFATEEVVPQW
jgi:hypothetical protein